MSLNVAREYKPIVSSRVSVALFGLVNLGLFLVAISWLYLFLFNERAKEQAYFSLELGTLGSLALDIFLLSFMSLPHSFLLDSKWRARTQRIVAPSLFVTLYSVHASFSLIAMFYFWQPLGGLLYQLEGSAWVIVTILNVMSWLYMGYALYSTGALKHNGVEQWFNYLRGRSTRHEVPYDLAYRSCRHPIFLAFFLMIWVVPQMSLGRLVIAIYWSVYLVYGTLRKEEKLLRNAKYARYVKEVPPYPFLPKKPFKSLLSRG